MKKMLIFIFTMSFLLFISLTDNVYARESIPYNSWYGADGQQFYYSQFYIPQGTSSFWSFSLTGDYSVKYFNLSVVATSDTSLNVNDQNFINYPFVIVYFLSNSGNTDSFVITRAGGCTNSCYSEGYTIKSLGLTWYNSSRYYRYALILPVAKYNTIALNEYEVADTLGFWQVGESGSHSVIFTSVALSDNGIVGGTGQTDNKDIIINNNNNTQNIINNQNQNQAQTHQDMQNIDNTMKDETGVPNSDVSDKTSEWSSKLAGTGPVSNMVLMPITLLNGYISGFNSTCSPYNLGNLMGTDIILPCINISNYLGATLWGVIDVLFSGFMIYAIGKKFVKIFNDFTNLRDNQIDELYGGGK